MAPDAETIDQIDVIVADLEKFTAKEIIALSLNVDANLRESPPLGTPVDTGWAKANWVPSVGKPFVVDADDRNPPAAVIAARQEQSEQGRANVLRWTKNDGPIFISNNVPYIQALNAGHSTQSPPGFVQTAIEQAVKETYSAGASKALRQRRAAAYVSVKPRPIR